MDKRIILPILALAVVTMAVLTGCSIFNQDRVPLGWFEYTRQGGIEIADIPDAAMDWSRPLPELPVIDGSSSTMLMHAAIRAFLTDEHIVYPHSQTYAALERLFPGNDDPADVVLAVRYYDEVLQNALEQGADLVVTPVAREGFVFILHKDNPVDSLTQQQLRDIYSGRVTNWSQVGGMDEEIRPFTRNWDSGSQTAMEEFMGSQQLIGENDITMLASMGALLF